MNGDNMANTKYGEDIAVLKDQMKEVKVGQERIEGKLDIVLSTYATKAELKSFKWVTIPLVIVGSGVLTFLLTFFLGHLNSGNSGANNPTTSTTTTVNNPAGSTSTTTTKDGTPSTTSSATAHSDAATPADSQTDSGGVTVTLPKVP